MPEGRIIKVKKKFKASEILFSLYLYQKNYYGIHIKKFDYINKWDIDIRKELYKNIILSGGNTMIKGFYYRLKKEIKNLVPIRMKNYVKVIVKQERKYSSRLGGTILRFYLFIYYSVG